MLFVMNELEEMWTNALLEAELKAAKNKSGDIGDYVRLRETNDAAREIGIAWLFETFQTVAAEANRRGLNISLEKTAAHHFAVGAATMRGALVRLRLGVRSLTIEAGFPRTPRDGFVRGNGLACARVTHFGFPKANEDLLLVRADPKHAPAWFALGENNLRQPFQIANLKRHFATFLNTL
jgi:hypothetical protein